MKKQYKIRDGFSISEGSVFTPGGSTVELTDEEAAKHAHKLELVAGGGGTGTVADEKKSGGVLDSFFSRSTDKSADKQTKK